MTPKMSFKEKKVLFQSGILKMYATFLSNSDLHPGELLYFYTPESVNFIFNVQSPIHFFNLLSALDDRKNNNNKNIVACLQQYYRVQKLSDNVMMIPGTVYRTHSFVSAKMRKLIPGTTQ
jgi:hypothetical protein